MVGEVSEDSATTSHPAFNLFRALRRGMTTKQLSEETGRSWAGDWEKALLASRAGEEWLQQEEEFDK